MYYVDHLDSNMPFTGALRGMYILQVRPTQHALEHAACGALIRHRELDHTDEGYI